MYDVLAGRIHSVIGCKACGANTIMPRHMSNKMWLSLCEYGQPPVAWGDFVVEVDGGLCVEEAVCAERGEQVHDEVVEASVPCVYQLCHIFEHIVKRFDDAALAQHDFVINGHEPVLHVGLDASHQMHPIIPQLLEQTLGDIALVGIQLTEKTVRERLDDILIAVIHIRPCQHEVQYFPLLVADKVQFETDVPAHRALALLGDALENPHAMLPLVVNHRDARAVDEGDARALAEADQVQEHDHRHEAARLQLDKTVIRDSVREEVLPVLEHALAVVVLEVAECVIVERHHHRDHLGLAHPGCPIAPFFAVC